MEDQLYVRIRGRVQGPFDKEKLRGLVKRGQLSRMHEVSPDGNDWKPASEYQELFATEARQAAQQSEPVSKEDQPVEQEAVWYYSVNGVQAGPVTFEQLQSQAAPGHLSSDDLVWKEGMKDWVPGAAVPGLLFCTDPMNAEATDATNTTTTNKLGGGLLRTLKDSQGWIRFIVFFLFLSFAVASVAGLWFVIRGIHEHTRKPIEIGIYWLLYSAIFFYAGWLLNSFRKRVGRFLQDKSPARLDQALRSLRALWIYVSIIFIILLVGFVVLLFNAVAALV